MNVVWSIAGLDPSGGAGLVCDAKVFAALGVHGVTIATAITSQGLDGCCGYSPLSEDNINAQIDALGSALAPAAIKIGMLGSLGAVRAVKRILMALEPRPFVVLDPVLGASTGARFADETLARAMVDELAPLVDLVTPNHREAQAVTWPGVPTLVTGGPSAGQAHSAPVVDRLYSGAKCYELYGKYLPWNARGTGCALSAAIAAFAARGEDLVNAVVAARAYVSGAIRRAHLVDQTKNPQSSRILQHGVWPVAAEDFPTLGVPASAAFIDCGPKALGFYPIVDRATWVRRLAAVGVRTIQLRIKDLTAAALKAEITEAHALCSAAGVRLFINDHWQQALAVGAYGVHLGQEDLHTADVETLRAAGMRLGISTHSYAELARARAFKPSYVALGPIYPTTLKVMPFAPQGLARLNEWKAFAGSELVAIGGISLERAPAILAQGVRSIAVVSDITQHPAAEVRASDWCQLLSRT